MARVVLLGGTGYIGRPLAAALVARDHEVRAIVRDAGRLQVPGVAGIVADVLTPDSWRATVGPGDTIGSSSGPRIPRQPRPPSSRAWTSSPASRPSASPVSRAPVTSST